MGASKTVDLCGVSTKAIPPSQAFSEFKSILQSFSWIIMGSENMTHVTKEIMSLIEIHFSKT